MLFLLWLVLLVLMLDRTVAAYQDDKTIKHLIPPISKCDYRKSSICDPDRVLSQKKRDSFELVLSSGLSSTVCFCNQPCYLDGSDRQRLVFGILFLRHTPSTSLDGPHLAEKLRSSFALGSCRDNDVFILATEKEISVAYGSLVIEKLLPCMQNLHTKYDVSDQELALKRIHQLTFALKSLLNQSCVCRNCDAPQFWFKLVAMLLACISLLIWLSLFGRRIYMRRFTAVIAASRSRHPVFDDSSSPGSLFTPRYSSVGPLPRRHITPDPGQSRIISRTNVSRSTGTALHSSSPIANTGRQSPPPPDYSQVTKSESPKSNIPHRNPTTNDPIHSEVDSSPPSYSDVLACSQQQQQRQHHQETNLT